MRRSFGTWAADLIFKHWTGYSREDAQQFKFWGQTTQLLYKDQEPRDEWIEAKQQQLLEEMDPEEGRDQAYWAYGRARLEERLRHQSQMRDGRLAARLPVCGISREKLIALGIDVDNFEHELTGPENDADYTVILQQGWSLRATEGSDRWAGVYNEADARVLDVLYIHRPHRPSELHQPYGSFVSSTRLAES